MAGCSCDTVFQPTVTGVKCEALQYGKSATFSWVAKTCALKWTRLGFDEFRTEVGFYRRHQLNLIVSPTVAVGNAA